MLNRRRIHVALLAALAVGLGGISAVSASAAPCPEGTFLISGTVTDEATGLPLTEVTSVGVSAVDGSYDDGLGTAIPGSTWESCIPPNDYRIAFFDDSYNLEWYDDQPDATSATIVHVAADTTGLDAALSRLAVITGRVIDQDTGEGLFTSIGLQSVDGTFNDGLGTDDLGNFRIAVPGPGTYLLNFSSDFHWSEWWNNKKRRSQATVITITATTSEVGPWIVRLRRCSDTVPDFCIPPHFND